MNYKIRIVFDVDGTLCDTKKSGESYFNMLPKADMCNLLRDLKKSGCIIILNTARYMYTYAGNQEEAISRGRQELIDWCKKWDIPWDEIYLGKPAGDIYIDDKAINSETIKMISKNLNFSPR